MAGLRFGVIGCGAISDTLHLPVLAKNNSICSELHLLDADAARLDAVARKFHATTTTSDLQTLIDRIDVAIVATPPASHYQITNRLLDAGKDVLCEKPLTLLPKEAISLVDAAERSNLLLMTNNLRRLWPALERVRQIISGGELGRPIRAEWTEGYNFDWPTQTGHNFRDNKPGAPISGVLFDLGAHSVDLMCCWFGNPTVVECRLDSFGGPDARAHLKLDFAGVEAVIDLSFHRKMRNTYRVVCEDGEISGHIHEHGRLKVTKRNGEAQVINLGEVTPPVVEDFAEAALGLRQPAFTSRDVLPSIVAIAQAYAAAKPFDAPWLPRSSLPDLPGGSVLVTGAGGFLGGAIVEALHFAGGFTIRAGVRRWTSAARIARLPIQVVQCDLSKTDQTVPAVIGTDYVIHCALGNDIPGNTERLLQAAKATGVKRIIHISSVAVYGNATGIVDETTIAPSRSLTSYGEAKLRAEEICRKYANDLDIVILRPTIIYGPFSELWTLSYAMRLKTGRWSDIVAEGKCNLVHANEVARFAIAALGIHGIAGQAFNVNGPEVITWREYFNEFNARLNLPPLRQQSRSQVWVLAALTRPIRVLGKQVQRRYSPQLKWLARRNQTLRDVMKRTELALRTTPNAQELAEFSRDAIYSVSKLERMFGMQPEITVDDGLSMTIAWLNHVDIDN